MNAIRKLLVLGALTALSVPSFAVTLSFSFNGSFTSNLGAFNVTGTTTDDSSDLAVSGVKFNYAVDGLGNVVGGTGEVDFATDPAVYFKFDGVQDTTMQGSVVSFYSDPTFSTASALGGVGSASYDLNDSGSTISNGQFVGIYNPVPEPASMAAMAIGVAGILARRKRRAH